MRKKVIGLILFFLLLIVSGQAFASYGGDMKTDLVRGLKNILAGPAEIPITFQIYHEGPGRPVVRQIGGVLHGASKAALRMASGVWDLVESLIPGTQQGFPQDPPTLF